MQNIRYTFWDDESGQDMAEYAILLALIAIVVILAINTLAPAIGSSFNNSAEAITNGGVPETCC